MNQLNNIFVEEIRRAGYNNKNRILLCNTYFSARLNLPKFVMPSDTASNKILVGIHDYTIRTGEDNYGLLSSLEWLGDKTPSGGYKYLDPEGEYKYNIFMDEFGIYNTESLDERKALMNTSVPASYELGIPMIIWDEGGKYAIMKKDSAAWDENTDSNQVAAVMIGKAEENTLPLHDCGEATYSWSSNKKTCTANRQCKRQGCSYEEEETAITSEEITKEASCKETGIKTFTATYDNPSFETQTSEAEIKKLPHTSAEAVEENVVEPTCEKDGSHDEVVYCSVCEAELSRVTKTEKALGHEWREPTYTWSGDKSNCTAKRVCSRDKSHVEEETVDSSKVENKATCEEAGKITYTANFSNEAFETQETETPIPAKGHLPGSSITENVIEPTCEKDGSRDEVVYCSVCRKELSRDKKTDNALGHIWDGGVITRQPTGKMEGVKEYHCTVCGEVKTEFLPKLPAGTDPNQKGSDGTALGKGASQAAAEKAITEMKSDNDPAGSKFSQLQLRSVKQAKTSVTVTWKKVKNTKKYLLYGNACGNKNKMKKIATISAGKKSYVVKKAAGKKVKKGTYYKFLMVVVDKNGNVISTSKVIHVASKGGKVGNHKSITITAKVNGKGKAIKKYKALSKTVIRKGKKITLKSKPVPASKKLKVKKHRGPVYESSNPKVAKVSGKGVVKAVKKGTATIYAYAQNGVFKSVKITVK